MTPPSVAPLHEVVAIKTAANTHDIEAHEDRLARIEARLTRIEAKSDVTLECVSDMAAGITELLRRVP
jgi:hypothetical protein